MRQMSIFNSLASSSSSNSSDSSRSSDTSDDYAMETTKLNHKFKKALKQEAYDVVDNMLDKGYIPKPNSISIPCKEGNVDLLVKLLKYPMDLQKGLIKAVRNNQVHILNRLFLAGANLNSLCACGDSILMYATNVETCQWLLDMGTNQTPSQDGTTPLLSMCSRNYPEIVKLLLSHSQGTFDPDGNGTFPLSAACGRKRLQVVELLLSYPQGVESILQVDGNGRTPLFLACYCNPRPQVVELLLSYPQGVETIKVMDKNCMTPLHAVCSERPLVHSFFTLREHMLISNLETIKILLSYPQGMETISFKDNSGRTPLHWACMEGNIGAVKLLTSYSQGMETISSRDDSGTIPIRLAHLKGHASIVKFLSSFN